MSVDVRVAVVGGGVVGCAVAWKLSQDTDGVFLFEKNPGIARGENQTSRNSGVVHSGLYYDAETRPLKARLCVEGNRMLYEFCRRYDVPFIRTGKLIAALTEQEEEILRFYLNRARQNGVPDPAVLSAREVREIEPNVRARSALLLPSSGVVEPTALVSNLAALAGNRGVQFMTNTRVTAVRPESGRFRITIRYVDGKTDMFTAAEMVNAAGVDADEIARMLNPDTPFRLDPVRGEYALFYKHTRAELFMRGMNVYPTPTRVTTPHSTYFTVGVHLTPTLETNGAEVGIGDTVTVGPWIIPVSQSDDLERDRKPPESFHPLVAPFFPGLRPEDLKPFQAGIQARLRGVKDFVIQRDPEYPRAIHLLGIDSPGLTSCLAIAEYVAGQVRTPV